MARVTDMFFQYIQRRAYGKLKVFRMYKVFQNRELGLPVLEAIKTQQKTLIFHFIQISLFAWQLICMFGGPVKIKSISVKT
ncbi:hypothetical protein BAX97_14275 [Elizabethkingia meningoseptica]|nr:hypothetical protein BBD33_09505 [Elizabethkingia meningoseptica]EOR29513.1 hypothetical protein L100_10934 [Elizabethkingia meningoseptica ATCC 13253 = NBRC 12535]AQX47507.1 hypothetical protein B5G46_09495 [Elizabethkingia meningoseptica]KUY24227.1 hypothetical protein ATB99_01610 [Elizabethkingia meningoseptica]MVW91541.1 hypothetical protein [Elizabethkingia meningoseptica]